MNTTATNESESASDEEASARVPAEDLPKELRYKLYVLTKIRNGLREVVEGKTVPHDEVQERLLGKTE